MKRLISALLGCVFLIAATGALAEGNWWDDIGPEPTRAPAFSWADLFDGWTPEEEPEPEPLFDDGVSWITGSAIGSAVDFARMPGWTLTRGYYIDRYCIIGAADSGERMALTTNDPLNFVPAGDAFIYYGEHAKEKYGWLIKELGNNAPHVLPLGVGDSVFYADQERIWYFTFGKGTSITIRTMNHEGKQIKKLGTTNGQIVAMMPDEQILVVDFNKNRLSLWKGGESSTIYDPKDPIETVMSAGSDIWVQHAGGLSLVEDGVLTNTIPGRMITNAGNEHVLALLVEPFTGAHGYHDLYLFNADYRAWARVGTIRAQADVNIELRPDSMTVWGPVESRDFWVPQASAWLPYGRTGFEDAAMRSYGNENWRVLLVGSWHAGPSVGAGYAERLVFTEEWVWRLPWQEGGDDGEAQRFEWTVENDELVLYQQAQLMDRLSLAGPFDVADDESPYPTRAEIGGISFYKMSDDPEYFHDLPGEGD